ncbi:MAG TPA: DUF3618 domain-containing protein [Streptosporangiaceae bacterium]|nr:DUF3618 domain-containing protein [Streptosporangiaceae bacterium]
MPEPNGTVAVRDPDVLLKEIEATRENLARTIDAIADRASPANIARRAADRAREQLDRPEVRMYGGIAAAVVAVGGLAYLIRRRFR